MFLRSLIVFVFSMICLSSWGQADLRFGTGVFFGYNLSQIDGDDMQGYDLPGINFGIRGITYLLPKLEFHTELSYSQQGSQSKNFTGNIKVGRQLKLDYGGISGIVAINDWFHPVKEYYRFQLTGGVSLKRVIKTSIKDESRNNIRSTNFNEVFPYLESTDFAMILGANFKLIKNLGLSFRYNRSLNKILDADKVQMYFEKKQLYSMKGYFLSANVFYHF